MTWELNRSEQDTIRRCIVAILDGPFIEESEFQTRLGLDRAVTLDDDTSVQAGQIRFDHWILRKRCSNRPLD